MGFFGLATQAENEALRVELGRTSGRLDRLESAPVPIPSANDIVGAVGPILDALRERLALLEPLPHDFKAIEQTLKEMTFAVSEGIERVDRAERRIKQTIKRARKELAEHGFQSPGLEAESAEIQSVDGGGGETHGVHTLQEGVATGDEASSVAGVSVAELRSVNSKRLRLYQ